jgi:hypothetical protein
LARSVGTVTRPRFRFRVNSALSPTLSRLLLTQSSGLDVRDMLAVRTAKGVKLAGLKVVLRLGSARYDIAPGASRTLKVKLASGVQRVADSKGRLKVLAVASTGRSGKIAQSSQRLTLALGTATKTK